MGALFSRPGREDSALPTGAFSAGNLSSLDSPSIAPYLGINTGLYNGIPTSDLPPIPFEWIVSPRNVTDTCPNGARILTWFGVTEAVITLLTPLVAYRPLIHFLSRGLLGRRSKNSLWLAWTVTFACQLVANAVAAGLIGNTPGYGHLNMLHIFTVLMARPRFHFVVLGLLRTVVRVRRPRSWDGGTNNNNKTTIIRRKDDGGVEFPYTDAWIATSLSEMLLLIVSAIFTGVTWHRLPEASKAREFISDHVSFVASAPGLLLLCMVALVPFHKRYGEAFPSEGRRYETGRHWGVRVRRDGTARVGVKHTKRQTVLKRWASAVVGGIVLAYVTLVQFAYWARFLEMSGVLFCPPKLVSTGIVWTVFTLAGLVAGAAS
ncbi:hypothetical protein JDV02_006576 [Purpureocillium takamizusanense]|uniref:Uncharacterized protein n=1 Tax=Purpureocillium takamizusanense TaxID=2060973 RepID=A0A9Q8VCW2_9HYPO|nr:uncharacterized protein JDV02_006576 [Purpureocillium takamizusanense]UNI20496.1 hypothetical protein JDV02_006576 [Purpureocillium takamizusanense]